MVGKERCGRGWRADVLHHEAPDEGEGCNGGAVKY